MANAVIATITINRPQLGATLSLGGPTGTLDVLQPSATIDVMQPSATVDVMQPSATLRVSPVRTGPAAFSSGYSTGYR